jgi:hypothetical protein
MHLPTLATLTAGLRGTLRRFPVPTLFAVVTSGLLVASINEGFDDSLLFRFAFLTGLGFVASLLCDLIAEATGASTTKRFLGQIGIVLLLVFYSSLIMPDLLDAARPPFWYGYFILLFALHLGIALVPALAPGGAAKLWRFNLSCFLRYFFSSVNAALLFGGLALALLSIDKLFELGAYEELYFQLWVLCAFLAHPLLFLGGLPRPGERHEAGDFPKALRFSLCFIGLPLVALYLLILYAYVAKIALQWSWPNGWVAMPIFVLGVIGLLTYVLSFPLPKSENWARLYHRWLFRLLLPLSIVLFMALQVRLNDYGMTINRYLGLALAVWLFGISLAYMIRPTLKIGWMPFSLLVVSLVSIYGGPIGAFGWSERAQIERVRMLSMTMGAWQDGTFVPVQTEQNTETAGEFQSALRYLLDNFGAAPLDAELAAFYASRGNRAFQTERGYHITNQIMNYLELDDDLEKASTYFNASRTVLPTHEHAWMLDDNFYGHRHRTTSRRYTFDDTELSFTFEHEANTLRIQTNETDILQVDLTPWVAEVKAAVARHGRHHEKPLVWHAEGKGWRFSFVCTHAQLNPDAKSFQNVRLTVFLTPPE